MAAAGAKLSSVEFEVFGRVQGVFFRKYTQETAQQHNLVGWCKNTHSGTVLGIVQGPKNKVDLIKHWLRNTGSPKSRIIDCQFKNEKEIDKCDFKEFQIVRPAKKKRKP